MISELNIAAVKAEIHSRRFHPADSLRMIAWMIPDIERLATLDEPVQQLVKAWRALGRCNDELDRPEDCAEYQDAFESAVERLATLVGAVSAKG